MLPGGMGYTKFRNPFGTSAAYFRRPFKGGPYHGPRGKPIKKAWGFLRQSRRKYVRKSFKYARKHFKPKYSRRLTIPGKMCVPQVAYCNHMYRMRITPTTPAGPAASPLESHNKIVQIRINDLINPTDHGSDGHPEGVDHMGAKYERYRVISASVYIVFINQNAAAKQMVWSYEDDDSNYTQTDIEEIMSARHTMIRKYLMIKDDGRTSGMVRMKRSFNLAKVRKNFVGKQELHDWGAASGASPTQVHFIFVGSATVGGAGSTILPITDLYIKYHVKWFDLKHDSDIPSTVSTWGIGIS